MYAGITQLLHYRITVADAVKYAAISAVIAVLAVAMVYEMDPFGFGADLVAPAAQVVVHEGDTLWSLAQTYGPSHADPRRTVSRIREINHLTGSLIRPGEVVLVPRS